MDCCPHTIGRRALLGSLGASALLLAGRGARAQDHDHTMEGMPGMGEAAPPVEAGTSTLYDEAVASAYPEAGFQSRIAVNGALLDLVANDVIVVEKFESLYAERGGLPAGLEHALHMPMDAPIHLTRGNASTWVNLLWPLGLANHLAINADSPIRRDLMNFASTGGWQLGREKNGGAYFDRFPILALSADQEARVLDLAESIFRPCCNNSAFFQDCNHGSAMYALMQLGVLQGLTAEQLYAEALAFNAFWFPDAYIKTAIYLKMVTGQDWASVEPRVIVGPKFSAGRPWGRKVEATMAAHPELIPAETARVNCGA